MIVKVYDKPGCPKCRMTERSLNTHNIPFIQKTLLLPNNKEYTDKKLKQFSAIGFKSFPVVKVYNDDKSMVDEWCDFRVDKLKELRNNINKG